MGALKYSKSEKVFLRDVGLDERWLQDRIAEDPSIIGLGDLTMIERERVQPKGRLDLLLSNFETGVRYVTEIQLGSLDESHLIRTVEYWDIERKRFPSKEHIGVVVAEDVTSRFLNVITLLNSSIPLIVLQLDSRSFEGNIFLNFIRVIDYVEQIDEEEADAEKADRNYWMNNTLSENMNVVDDLLEMIRSHDPKADLIYNKYHIALGGRGRFNYAWFHPRKSKYVRFRMRYLPEDLEKATTMCEDAGLEIHSRQKQVFGFNLTAKSLKEHRTLIEQLVQMAIKASL